jgi:hypothetical protein
MLLQACLGLHVQASPRRLVFRRATLPDCLPRLQIEKLPVGDSSVSLVLGKTAKSVSVTVLNKPAGVDIICIK